jgi:hypothetical protein
MRKSKKHIKVRDLKPKKDAKGGGGTKPTGGGGTSTTGGGSSTTTLIGTN